MRLLAIFMLLGAVCLAHANAEAETEELTSDFTRTLLAQCSLKTPIKRDYSWTQGDSYKGFNGFAYSNYSIKGGIRKTKSGVKDAEACFKVCVNSIMSPRCLSFAYDKKTNKCYVSSYSVPYDPTDPDELKTATKWCPKKGWVAGWIADVNDK